MMTAGIAQRTSTTQRGEGTPTQPSAVLSMPQFGSKMKYHTIATAAPDRTVGVNSTVRAPFRKRRRSLSSRASNRPSSRVQPTDPTVNVAVFRAICQKRLLVKTVTQLSSPTKRLTGEIMSHSVKLRLRFWTSGQYEKMLKSSRFGPTNATKVSHSRHSQRDRVVRGLASARVAELTTLAARICRSRRSHTLTGHDCRLTRCASCRFASPPL